LKYCHLLARATAQLDEDPTAALVLAQRASALLPGDAGGLVVAGRAALRSGRPKAAMKFFDRAAARDRRSLEPPVIMFDHAHAAAQNHQRQLAARVYRALVPRVSLLPSREHRALALLRAAHLTMGLAPEASDTARQQMLRQAIAFLREAQRDPHHRLRRDVTLSLAFALLRAGRAAAAEVVLSTDKRLHTWTQARRISYLDHPGDGEALRGLALERSAPRAAAAHYSTWLADPKTRFRSVIAERARAIGRRGTR
jgi:tetratricopeptide (TPR) repeat protein